MPKRSVSRPAATPPRPKPAIVSVKASEAPPRLAPNSFCTAGSATTTDHIPTEPIEPMIKAMPSRAHAWRESGMKWGVNSRILNSFSTPATSWGATRPSSEPLGKGPCRSSATTTSVPTAAQIAICRSPEDRKLTLC